MSLKKISYFFEKTATTFARGVRFLTDDKPTEETFRNLLDSVVFKTEIAHRAKEDKGTFDPTVAGWSVAATNAQVAAKEGPFTDRTLFVQPHQIPDNGGLLATDGDTVPKTYLDEKIVGTGGVNVATSEINTGEYQIVLSLAPTLGAVVAIYVDSNNLTDGTGIITNPFKTIELALTKVATLKDVNRVTVYVAGGSYTLDEASNLWVDADWNFARGAVVTADKSAATVFTAIFDQEAAVTDSLITGDDNNAPNVFGFGTFITSNCKVFESKQYGIGDTTITANRTYRFSFLEIECDRTAIYIESTAYVGGGQFRHRYLIEPESLGTIKMLDAGANNYNRGIIETGVAGGHADFGISNIILMDETVGGGANSAIIQLRSSTQDSYIRDVQFATVSDQLILSKW
jgi:hypothetical protein